MQKINAGIILSFYLFSGSIFVAGQENFDNKIKLAEEYLKNRGEVYFQIKIKSKSQINYLSQIVSVDKYENNRVYAYANKNQFQDFLKLKLEYKVLTPPSLLKPVKMLKSIKHAYEWNYYPNFQQYIGMMHNFAQDYPSICQIYDIGSSVEGRSILFVKISDNVEMDEPEPEFMYSSTMHGDETTGYVLMLRLIDYLLRNYSVDSKVTHLVDNLEIWINPLSNPDATYFGGDDTVYGAKRYNINNIDLNRNFPDPEDGMHPDGNDWQPETMAMMTFMEKQKFVLSANLHTGAEVINYPWDTWERYHADDDWYKYISRQYADTVHVYSSNYMDDSVIFDYGITNGYKWYTINGGRQDYVNYFLNVREVTMELSDIKLPDAEELPEYWNYNYRSLLNYIEQGLYGIQGVITDPVNGDPLYARIEVANHDFDNSHVISDSVHGDFFRLINQGIYDLKITSPGYKEKIIYGIQVFNQQPTYLDVQLVPEIQFINFEIYSNLYANSFEIAIEIPDDAYLQLNIFDMLGNQIEIISNDFYKKGIYTFSFKSGHFSSGIYICQLNVNGLIIPRKLIIMH